MLGSAAGEVRRVWSSGGREDGRCQAPAGLLRKRRKRCARSVREEAAGDIWRRRRRRTRSEEAWGVEPIHGGSHRDHRPGPTWYGICGRGEERRTWIPCGAPSDDETVESRGPAGTVAFGGFGSGQMEWAAGQLRLSVKAILMSESRDVVRLGYRRRRMGLNGVGRPEALLCKYNDDAQDVRRARAQHTRRPSIELVQCL